MAALYNLTTDLEQEYNHAMEYVARHGEQYGEAMFWAFCQLRQKAWARKAMGLEKPWTADPIIAHWRFTNLYRELDFGTLYMCENVQEAKGYDVHSLVLLTAFYRCFNRPETWEALSEKLGGLHGIVDDSRHGWELTYEFFNEGQKNGLKLFTGAYMMTSMAKLFHERQLSLLTAACSKISSQLGQITLKEATRILEQVPYMGAFSAFQVAMDLSIPIANNAGQPLMQKSDLDDWVALGPGSKAGAKLVRKDLPAETTIRYLRENQFLKLAAVGGDSFPRPTKNGEPLKMRAIDIEHSLCEYAKYRNALNGGRMKAKLDVKAYKTTWSPSHPTPAGWRYGE